MDRDKGLGSIVDRRY